VSPPVPNSDMAQLCCHNPHCRVQLMYPRGALQVQCSLCGTLNDAQQANQLGHVVCGGCQITLMYAHGAQSVKCAACNHVTQVARPGGVRPPPHQHHVYQTQTSQQAQQQLPQSSSAPPEAAHSQQISNPPAKPVQAVLVENPPTLDDGGNEVHNVSLGLARNGDRIQSEAKWS